MIVDFRRGSHFPTPLHSGEEIVEVVSSFRNLGLHLSMTFTWRDDTSCQVFISTSTPDLLHQRCGEEHPHLQQEHGSLTLVLFKSMPRSSCSSIFCGKVTNTVLGNLKRLSTKVQTRNSASVPLRCGKGHFHSWTCGLWLLKCGNWFGHMHWVRLRKKRKEDQSETGRKI